ncbi:MAG: hypothetical protein PHT44_00170 [Candidatus Portnoybacteria bacterium]|nr:hypothetical protein [Candidatus Portnoybacteria bacterium]MDD4982966.1 hypothetical protein [Candidatus Portnoybacteria bacterium]
MITVKAKFTGVSPILMNPATDDMLNELFGGAGARKAKDADKTPDQEAAKKVIKNENGIIGIPASYLFSCLVEAGRLVKLEGKRAISTKDTTLLPSFLAIEEIFFPFHNQEEKWKTDKRRGIIPGKGITVCIVRPRFDKWVFSATFTIDEKACAEDKAKTLVERAGSSVGLGDFRPARRGPFGRFRIESWESKKAV